MNKILNYIRNGKGIGAIFISALSVLFVAIMAIYFSSISNEIVEKLQVVSEKILPIKIENKIVVDPVNTRRETSISIDGENINFVFDSNVDAFDVSELKQGVYLSKKNLYVVSNGQTRVEDLAVNLDLPQGDYREVIKSYLYFIKWMTIAIAFVIIFLFYLCCTVFYAFCAGLIGFIFRKEKLSFSAKMRLSAFCFSIITVLTTLLSAAGIALDWSIVLIIMLLVLGFYFIKFVPAKQN